MNTIKYNIINKLIINKSIFITLLIRVNNEDDVEQALSNIKNEYNDATHYCYGYIVNNIKRCSDDGEPGGTAGLPILNTLEAHNLDLVLCVVVR